MNRHLSADEICECLAVGGRPELQSHLESCAVCSAQSVRLENALHQFKSSVYEWSAAQAALPASRRPARAGSRLVLAAVFGALAICALVGVSVEGRRNPSVALEPASDAVLLKQIDAELSREAPRSMEPLTQLVSWDEDRR